MNRLRETRKALNLSREELARRVGVSPATIGRWARGESEPYPVYRDKLAEALGVTYAELGFDESVKEDGPLKEKPKEHPSTYFVADRSSEDELSRLDLQDGMLTRAMGGVLAEQPEPARFQRVLDVGCGTGGWLIEVAKAYPTISRLVGVDVSQKMVTFATEQARAAGVSDRVEFHAMDALRMLEFPDGTFDLINQRLCMSWLRTWDWPGLLNEYQRIMKRNGTMRITESATPTKNNGPASMKLGELWLSAFYQCGYLFSNSQESMIVDLPQVVRTHFPKIQIQTKISVMEYHYGTPDFERFARDMEIVSRVGLPFLQKWLKVPDDYEDLCREMIHEMKSPDFWARTDLITIWGNR